MDSFLPGQPSFFDLGTALLETTFCVVDLETTGASAQDEVTEIGAVKVRGGEVLGEFQTLVRPNCPIPPMIQVLTGITDPMVATAPSPAVAVPSFLDFAAGSVLVAHNARFDIGFLKRACQELGLAWPRFVVIDTVALSRQALLRGEVRNHKLSTLAAHFNSATQPDHRALSDARATVDVLHGLLERVGSLAVDTLEDLIEFLKSVSPDRRAKRTWAKNLPEVPGVYWFEHRSHDASDAAHTEVLYVGKSRNLRRRVASYFSAAEQRNRIHEMVRVASGVEVLPCATELEAEVRELRMIASHKPRYNRRSKRQHQLTWLKLTKEPFPRLATVRKVGPHDVYWGPFPNAAAAAEVAQAIHDGLGIRECKQPLSTNTPSRSCALAELDRCCAPCLLGEGAADYPERVTQVERTFAGDLRRLLGSAAPRLGLLVADQRFEEAGQLTNRLLAAHRISRRFHRVRSLANCPELVAAAPEGEGWAIHVIRYAKLAAAARAKTAQVQEVAAQTKALAETVSKAPDGLPAGSFEEAERVAAWLESPGLRFLDTEGDWAWPLHCSFDQDSVTELITTGVLGRSPGPVGVVAMASTTACEPGSLTSPKMV